MEQRLDTSIFPYDEFPVGRPYKIYSEYVALGEKLNLTYLGMKSNGSVKESPRSVRTPSFWKCNLCGTVMKKAYRSVDAAIHFNRPGCMCQSKSNDESVYIQAGKIIGWTFVGPKPRTNKQPTNWKDFYGYPIQASLVEITNNPQGKIRRKFRDHVNPRILITGVPKRISDWKTE